MKAYTDIEQSKKLSEILPIESADMWYCPYPNDVDWHNEPNIGKAELLLNQLPCWSLAALIEQLDGNITNDDGSDLLLEINKENGQYYLYYYNRWRWKEYIETDYYDNLIDACYEMIIKLHEEKLL